MTDKEILSWIDTVIADYMYPDVEEELIEVRSKVHDLFESYEMLAKRDWIPVSERLPEEGEPILFSTKTGRVYEGAYFDLIDNRQWYAYEDENYAWNNVVTAWMPLPQPYKAESEE